MRYSRGMVDKSRDNSLFQNSLHVYPALNATPAYMIELIFWSVYYGQGRATKLGDWAWGRIQEEIFPREGGE